VYMRRTGISGGYQEAVDWLTFDKVGETNTIRSAKQKKE
jgi:hypothetical protein